MNDIDKTQFAIQCQGLAKSYRDGKTDIAVLSDIDFAVKKGQKVAVLGLSGSGKTTLLNILGGLDKPNKGQVYLNGIRFDNLSPNKRALMRNKHLGFIYQLHHLLPEFTALENVMLPLMIHSNRFSKAEGVTLAKEMLDHVGLDHRYHHKPQALSGGERQRVAIARALVAKPSCVLADEPTGNLDQYNSEKILKLMTDLSHKFHIGFVVVTHDTNFAKKMDVVYQINDGQLLLKSS